MDMRSLRSFFAAREGNVAVMFGLMVIPILGLSGAAIDYSLAARDRSAIQEAIDSGALAGSRLLGIQTDAQARTQAEAFVRANLPTRMQTMPLNIEIINSGAAMRISAARSVPTSILQVVGRSAIDVSATTTANAPSYREIELVMALDNTGSMGWSGKIEALRTASLEMITILEQSGRRPGDVRVGLVPFNTVVRVNASTYGSANWLRDVPGGWQGCVTDRDSPYNTNDSAPTAYGRRFPAVTCNNDSDTLARVVPLTSNFTTVRNGINAMTPVGMTNVTIGVAWGWHLLSSGTPFTETQSAAEPNVDRWLIVLTDGDNTQDRFSTNENDINTRTQAACNNLRAQATTIRVVTVRVMDGNAALLRSCASNENYYYEVSNANQLIDVFRRIAWEITALRLTN
jgi:Flp pilus assembly protein TadG